VVLAGCQQRALHMVEASGERAMRLGEYEKAANEYSEVVERRPGRWDARVELSKALMKMEMPAEAREQLEIAYIVEPENEEVLNLLAEAMLESGDVGAMTTELRQRAKTRNTVGDWMRLGIFLQQAGDLDGAEQALVTAARIDGGRSAPPQMALASLYREAGDEEAALRRLRMALYVEPGNAKVQQAIRSYGEIPGPTYVLVPEERE
jgi:Flp pilus assembly protein TadD